MWKICTKCGKHKALWGFRKDSKSMFSTTTRCKTCLSAVGKQRYYKDHEKTLKNLAKYREENRELIREKDLVYRIKPRRRLMNNAWRAKNKNKLNKDARKRYWDKHEKYLCQTRNWFQENKKELCERRRLQYHGKATYAQYAHQLTIDELPRLSKDNITLEVKCKFCKKYFKPTKGAIINRIRTLQGGKKGHGEASMYCSEKCKVSCPTFCSKGAIPNTSLRETIPQELRDEVLQRNDGICEMCEERPMEKIHHEKPVSTHPHLQLDKENLWGLCEHCHYEVCHQIEGCTLPELKRKSINNCKI